MPYGATGLTDAEYASVQQWLQEGAPLDWQPWTATGGEQQQIEQWEAFFNASGAREALVSRWLYEHLFIAHIHFDGGAEGHFFRVVRSYTPSGKPVKEIATRRPNDEPGVVMYYRFGPATDLIRYNFLVFLQDPEHDVHITDKQFYPSFIFNVKADDVPTFVSALEQGSDEVAFRKVVEHWGIRRTHPQFWQYFHDLSEHIREREPLQTGVLGMNRYENL